MWYGSYYDGPGSVRWQEIARVRPVKIPGWEYLDCCIWKRPGGDWEIVEGHTGMLISMGQLTRGEAVALARQALDKAGREKVDSTIADTVAAQGESPRYRQKGAE